MRVKIYTEMSGNEFLDLLRKVPAAVGEELLRYVEALPRPIHTIEDGMLLFAGARQIIDDKKRPKTKKAP